MLRLLLVCLLVGNTADLVLGARILAVLPIPFKSHHIMFQAVLKALADRGHQIVNYSPFPLDKPVTNYTDVVLDTIPLTEEILNKDLLDQWTQQTPVRVALRLWENIPAIISLAFKSNKLTDLLHTNEKFDLILLESFFAQEVLLGLGHKFKCPVVTMLSFGSFHVVNRVSGNSLCPSYIPDFAFSYSDRMTLYERIVNSYSIFSSLYYYYTEYLPSQENAMKTLYNDSTMPPLVDMVHNISLVMNNAHPYVLYPQPYTPNIVPIGGIHLVKEEKQLPQRIKTFLEDAKEGVIYFSLGSLLPDNMMPQQFYDKFLSVFRRLPQRVVWKTGAELSDLPDNVMTVKWAPQQDILAHPNVLLFMTHGGILSMHETINAALPVVCIPFFGDQHLNARYFEEKGIGIALPYNTLTEDSLYTATTRVLNTPAYKHNMRRLSAIYKDRPMSPADSLVFWVEYVLRHRGAHHLRPTSSTMPWYQLALLDVIGVLGIIIFVALMLCYIILKNIYNLFKRKQNLSSTMDKKLK